MLVMGSGKHGEIGGGDKSALAGEMWFIDCPYMEYCSLEPRLSKRTGYETRNNGALNGISSSGAYIASSGTKAIFARIGFGSGVNTAPSAAYKFSL